MRSFILIGFVSSLCRNGDSVNSVRGTEFHVLCVM